MNRELLNRAVSLAEKGAECGGGPFGAVIVKNGKVLAEAWNSVTCDFDPSAHAEVNAIRKACKALKTHDLSGAEIYCSCEPCPMCLGAIYWAHIRKIHFAAERGDAKAAGFDDDLIYSEMALPAQKRRIPSEKLPLSNAKKPFEIWEAKADKEAY